MFQYAFAKATALRNNVDFKLDISEYERYFRPYELEIFEIEKKYASKEEIPRYERRKPHNYVLAGGWRCMIKCFWKQLNMYHYSENSFAFTPALTNIVN
ncbi:MAG: hypothetical protein LBP53_05990 [Candidatus Peribacteria bacterium]|jgi:hypothetical protein|nr:hypothetical protein [Candidatus Peribacteria bacterium]